MSGRKDSGASAKRSAPATRPLSPQSHQIPCHLRATELTTPSRRLLRLPQERGFALTVPPTEVAGTLSANSCSDHHPAINHQRRSRRERTGVGGEIDRRPDDFFGLADAAQRFVLHEFLEAAFVFPKGFGQVRTDDAGADAVDADLLAAQFAGHDF